MAAGLTRACSYNVKLMGFEWELLDRDNSGVIEFNEVLAYMIDSGALDREDGTRPVHG